MLLPVFLLIALLLATPTVMFGAPSEFTEDDPNQPANTGFDKRKHILRNGPDFFIIGAQKCATTSLHHLLLSHSSICPSAKKEIHYFDRINNWSKGAGYYLAHFKARNDKQGVNSSSKLHFVDATPDYFANTLAPMRIHQSFPSKERAKKKFILILREPAAREFSWYNHRVRLCTKSMREYLKRLSKDPGPVEISQVCADKHCAPLSCKSHAQQAVLGKETRSVANFTEYYHSGGLVASKGLYMTHLQRWLTLFPRKQFFIVNLATLLLNTTDTVQRLTHFLDIPEFPLDRATGGGIVLPHENSARVDTTFDCAARSELYSYYEKESQELAQFMASSGNGTGLSVFEPPFPAFETQPCSPGQIS